LIPLELRDGTMHRRLLVGLAVVFAIATAGAATAIFAGDLGGVNGDEGSIESFPTETTSHDAGSSGDGAGSSSDESPASDEGAGDGTSTTTAGSTTQPFTFAIVEIAECGQTCRDVTLELRNHQSTSASNVTVYSRIFVGNGTDGDVVWEGSESVGTLAAGESVTATERVDLSLSEAFAIQQADGWITIQTTVQSETETMTTTDRRNVT
jgi:hypothetical protein